MYLEYTFVGKGFLGLKVIINDLVYYFINIYSPCSLSDKREMWMKLICWKNKLVAGEWVVGEISTQLKIGRRGGEGESL